MTMKFIIKGLLGVLEDILEPRQDFQEVSEDILGELVLVQDSIHLKNWYVILDMTLVQIKG